MVLHDLIRKNRLQRNDRKQNDICTLQKTGPVRHPERERWSLGSMDVEYTMSVILF